MPIGPAPPIRVEPADGEPDRQRLATTSSWLAIAVHLRGEGRFRIATVVHGPRFISRRSATESAGFGVIIAPFRVGRRSIPDRPVTRIPTRGGPFNATGVINLGRRYLSSAGEPVVGAIRICRHQFGRGRARRVYHARPVRGICTRAPRCRERLRTCPFLGVR